MNAESNYIVNNPRLILGYLDNLIQKKCLISAHFGKQNSGFLTTIVELDKKKRVVLLDSGPTSALDDELLASDKVLFRTDYEGIKVAFKGDAIRKIKKNNAWAFEMPVPNSMFWMQRRQFYRVKVPLSHQGSYCRVSHSADSVQAFLPLIDLSISGVALLNTDIEAPWAMNLGDGRHWEHCQLHLQSGAVAEVSLEIVYVNLIRANTIQMHQRIGCRFESLPMNFDSSIQHYMQEIELQKKNIA